MTQKQKAIAQKRPRNIGGKFVKKYSTPGSEPGLGNLGAATISGNQSVIPTKLPLDVVPNIGVPHIRTFMGIPNLPARLYRNLDEALRDSPSNAAAMRRDAFILESLFSRQTSTAELNYSIEADSEDPVQQFVANEIKKIIDNIPNRIEMFRNLLEATWFGKYSVWLNYGFKWVGGNRRFVIKYWQPFHGDKLVRDYITDQWGFRVNPAYTSGEREIRYSTSGCTEMFTDSDMECCLIHQHHKVDGQYEDVDSSSAILGLGLRSYCYWAWVNRQELLAWIFEGFERFKTGLLIGYYEPGNSASEEAVRTALEQQQQGNILLFPRPIGGEGMGAGLEFMYPESTSFDQMIKMIDNYFNDQLRRLIFGLPLQGVDKVKENAEYEYEACQRIIRYDADNLSNTITTQLLPVLLKHNFPGVDFELKFKLHVDKVDPSKFMEGCQRAYEMNMEIDENQVRTVLGLSKPAPGASVLKKGPDQVAGLDRTMRVPQNETGSFQDNL